MRSRVTLASTLAAATDEHGVDLLQLGVSRKSAEKVKRDDRLFFTADGSHKAAYLLGANRIVCITDLQQQEAKILHGAGPITVGLQRSCGGTNACLALSNSLYAFQQDVAEKLELVGCYRERGHYDQYVA